MLSKIFRTLYGDLTQAEFKKFGLLSLVFFFIIGTYWVLRPMKSGLFMKIVGESYLGYAKIGSPIFLIFLVLLYGKLVDLLEKHQLVYVITGLYASIFLGITYFIAHPSIGLANTTPEASRWLGWILYLAVESYGSLVVALFWSFVASSIDPDSAKRGYPIIIFGAQLGAVTGTITDLYVHQVGIQKLFTFGLCGMVTVPLLIMLFVKMYGEPSQNETHSKTRTPKGTVPITKGTGPIEGLKLLATTPYLLGILGVSTLFEIIGTIMEIQMYRLANRSFVSPEMITQFSARYGLCANILSLVFALIGTSYFIRRFGLTMCLVLYPITVGVAVLVVWSHPILWSFVGAIVAVKGLSYALNNPCKEIMYIPTSRDIRFKAKSWIDTFGGRATKTMGALVSTTFPLLTELLFYGSIISLAVISIWIPIAFFVGRKNHHLVENKQIIE